MGFSGMPDPSTLPPMGPIPPGLQTTGLPAVPAQQQPQNLPPVGQPTIVREQGRGYDQSQLPPAPPVQQPGVPAQQPAQPVAPAQPQQPTPLQLSAETIIDGPGVPNELRGRTWGEISRVYEGLRNLALQSRNAPPIPQPPMQQPVAQPAAPAAQPQVDSATFWRDPVASVRQVVAQAVAETVGQQLAPVTQQAVNNQILAARNQVAQEIGPAAYQALEQDVMASLQGVDPRTLVDPAMWRVAVNNAAGQRALRGQALPARQQPAAAQPGTFAPQTVQPGANPVPNLNGFFSESPNGGARTQGTQLSQEQMQAADAMQMTHAQYAAWLGGIQPAGRQ
jgi:hypothetical protein